MQFFIFIVKKFPDQKKKHERPTEKISSNLALANPKIRLVKAKLNLYIMTVPSYFLAW